MQMRPSSLIYIVFPICAILSAISYAQDGDFTYPIEPLVYVLNAPTEGTTRSDLVNFRIVATVQDIDDGDTVKLKGISNAGFRIRLSDLDTPEIEHEAFTPRGCEKIPFRPGQPGGRAATAELKRHLSVGDIVTAECYEIDLYGRMVCHIFKDGKNVNLEMIKSGWGWLPSRSAWIRDPQSAVAEDVAKKASLGAWGLSNQVSPSEWRKSCWKEGNCEGAEKLSFRTN